MSEQRAVPEIPEDLSATHSAAAADLNGWMRFTGAETVAMIERIASLTAERDELQANYSRDIQQSKAEMTDLRTRYTALEKENADLKADVARLDWQPITPESLPKVGDEVYGKYCGDVHKVTNAMADWGAEKLTERCFHYFRPINPPSRTAPAKETKS